MTDRIKFVVETVRELAAIPWYWVAAKTYSVAEKIAPESLEDLGDGYPTDWQEETPDVTRWRSQQEGRPGSGDDFIERPVDAAKGEGVCADVVPLSRDDDD